MLCHPDILKKVGNKPKLLCDVIKADVQVNVANEEEKVDLVEQDNIILKDVIKEEMEEMDLGSEDNVEIIKESSFDCKINSLYAQDKSLEEPYIENLSNNNEMDTIYLQSELNDNLPILNESAIDYLMSDTYNDKEYYLYIIY